MNCSNIIPAIPGTTIIYYNKIHDSTQEEPVLFWGLSFDEDDEPSIRPFMMFAEIGAATPFDLLDCMEIIAFNIPGVGMISSLHTAPVYGSFTRQVKGYSPEFFGINTAPPTNRN